MQSIAELPEYQRKAKELLEAKESAAIVSYLAAHPAAGDLIQGTGGIRKLRWKRQGMGKRGGVRVIYYFHSEKMPLYLLTVFGKGGKDNLTKAERNMLADLVKELVKIWRLK